jgi:uncharacterized protein YqeY
MINCVRSAQEIRMLREKINEALKTAQKSKDVRAVSTLRLINAAIKDRDIAARGEGRPSPIPADEILQLLQKMVKQRKESSEIYEKAGRQDLATQEQEEIIVIESFLPKQMSDEEIRMAVQKAIADSGAAGLKDMGKIMAALKEHFAGQMDFAKAGKIVKECLA